MHDVPAVRHGNVNAMQGRDLDVRRPSDQGDKGESRAEEETDEKECSDWIMHDVTPALTSDVALQQLQSILSV
jgi:hypothetical protein